MNTDTGEIYYSEQDIKNARSRGYNVIDISDSTARRAQGLSEFKRQRYARLIGEITAIRSDLTPEEVEQLAWMRL